MASDSPSRTLAHDDLWNLRLPSDPQVSPDGKQVAFVVTTADRDADENRSAIWVTPAARAKVQLLTGGSHDRAPRWSPDGRRLAFLGSRDGKPAQVLLLDARGGEARPVTDLPLGAGEPVWSPDGRRVAFKAPVQLRVAARDDDPIVVDHLDHKADGAGRLDTLRMHLFVAEADGGATSQITFGEMMVLSEPVWSPDGQLLAFSAMAGEERDLAPASVIHTIPAAGGAPRAITPPEGSYQVAAWSADGATLLLTGIERLRAGHDRLWVQPAAGGPAVELAPGYDRNVMPGAPGYPGATPSFDEDGSHVVFCARERGAVHLLSVAAGGGTPDTVVGGDQVVSGASLRNGTLAYTTASADSPGEVWVAGTGEKPRQLTTLFADSLPDVRLFAPAPRSFTAPDGTELHGWTIRDPSRDGPGPVLLDVHGGPHNAWGPAFDGCHLYHQVLAAKGWTVLTLNPRGSDGYGEAFLTAVVGGWGTSDEADFHAALDALVEEGVADPGNLAVCGYSYGGYMTCWLTARSPRFKAAVAGGTVTDLVSMAGTSDLGPLIDEIELGADVVGEPEKLRTMSPLTYIAGARTPTLLLHGASDDRCPPAQAEQWFAALRQQKVPVEMVLYPGESHLFILDGKPTHRLDYNRRIEEWVTRSGPRARRAPPDLQRRLGALVERHGVVGASVAVLAGGEVDVAAAGHLHQPAAIAATPDSLFQIGSITKVYTTTLLMQLADEGRLDLGAPVAETLPELRVADPDVTKTVTMRHLLTHTSGIEGDHFPDTGRGDDCVARYVESCSELGQSHPLGATMSYCNAGFVIAGRVVEVLTGLTWDRALAERLIQPLELTRTVTLPEEALRHPTATGHVAARGKPVEVVPLWGLPRGCGPAGLICATASEVLAFARMHLSGGSAPDGTSVLSPTSVAAMQEPQVQVPNPWTLGSHWGLGWILFDWGARRVYGHDGGTIGQAAILRVVPDAGVAIALLTNGGNAHELYDELFRGLLAEMAGVEMPARLAPPPEPAEQSIDLDRHAGRYERVGSRIDIKVKKGRLTMTTRVTGPLAKMVPDPVTRYELTAVDDRLFLTRLPGETMWSPVVFYGLDDSSRYVHFGARATPLVS